MNTEIQNLTKVIEEKTLGAEDTNLNELRKLRDELTSQRDNLKSEVTSLKTQQEATTQEITGNKCIVYSRRVRVSYINFTCSHDRYRPIWPYTYTGGGCLERMGLGLCAVRTHQPPPAYFVS